MGDWSPEPLTFRQRLSHTVDAGVILGVKYAIAAILILLGVSWMLGDYMLVRQRSQNGQVAFEFLQKQVTQPPPTKPTTSP